MTPGEVLSLSDERDAHLARLLAAERDAYMRGYADGHRDGDEGRARRRQATWPAEVARVLADPPARRWHVCCRCCRLGGHQAGCTRCEDRTPATFGKPHPDDYGGGRQRE